MIKEYTTLSQLDDNPYGSPYSDDVTATINQNSSTTFLQRLNSSSINNNIPQPITIESSPPSYPLLSDVSTCDLALITSLNFPYGFICGTFGLWILPAEALRLFPLTQSLTLGLSLGIVGVSQLVCPIAGKISDMHSSQTKFGKRCPYISTACIFAALATLGMWWSSLQYWGWMYYAFLFIGMTSLNVAYAVQCALVPDALNKDLQGRASGFVAVNTLLGSGSGFALTMITSHHDFHYIYFLYIFFEAIAYVATHIVALKLEQRCIHLQEHIARDAVASCSTPPAPSIYMQCRGNNTCCSQALPTSLSMSQQCKTNLDSHVSVNAPQINHDSYIELPTLSSQISECPLNHTICPDNNDYTSKVPNFENNQQVHSKNYHHSEEINHQRASRCSIITTNTGTPSDTMYHRGTCIKSSVLNNDDDNYQSNGTMFEKEQKQHHNKSTDPLFGGDKNEKDAFYDSTVTINVGRSKNKQTAASNSLGLVKSSIDSIEEPRIQRTVNNNKSPQPSWESQIYEQQLQSESPYSATNQRSINPLLSPDQFKWSELIKAFHIDTSETYDFFWVFVGRTLYYVGVSVQAFMLYFLRDIVGTTNTSKAQFQIGCLALLAQFTAAAVAYPIGFITDKHYVGKKRLICIACLVMSCVYISFLLAPFFGHYAFTFVALTSVIYGGGNGCFLAVDYALALATIPKQENTTQALGIWGVAAFIGSAFGPLIWGTVIELCGRNSISGGYTYMGYAMMLIGGVIATIASNSVIRLIKSAN